MCCILWYSEFFFLLVLALLFAVIRFSDLRTNPVINIYLGFSRYSGYCFLVWVCSFARQHFFCLARFPKVFSGFQMFTWWVTQVLSEDAADNHSNLLVCLFRASHAAYLFRCLSVRLSVYPFVCLAVCLSVRLLVAAFCFVSGPYFCLYCLQCSWHTGWWSCSRRWIPAGSPSGTNPLLTSSTRKKIETLAKR